MSHFDPRHRNCPLSRRELILSMAGAAYAAGAAETRRIPPESEVARDPHLAALLRKVRDLGAKHDTAGLEALMLPEFKVEFDSGKGPAAFRHRWHSDSDSSRLWAVLDRLFSLGGTFYSDTLFAVPYVYTKFPADLDLLGHVVVVKAGARVLDKPSPDGAAIATLDYNILPLAQKLEPPVMITTGRYLEVKWPGAAGRSFVAEADIYSPVAHRAFFEKHKDGWRWITLVSATLAEPPGLHQAR